MLPEIVLALGGIPLTPYGTPGGTEIPDAIRPYLNDYDAFLLANHGCLTVGKDVFDAYYKLEATELFAKISLTARLLGGEKPISPPQVQELYDARPRYGVSRQTKCVHCGDEHEGACEVPSAAPKESSPAAARPVDAQRIVEEVTRLVQEQLRR